MLNPEIHEPIEQQEPESVTESSPEVSNSSPDVKQTEQAESSDTEQNEEREQSPAERIGREETEKRIPEMIKLVTRGLSDLFELLPKNRDTEVKDIVNLIEHTELDIMLPGMRKKFAKEAIDQKIHLLKDKAEFISQSLGTEAIKMFVHLEAMKAGSDATLERLRDDPEQNKLILEQLHKDLDLVYEKKSDERNKEEDKSLQDIESHN